MKKYFIIAILMSIFAIIFAATMTVHLANGDDETFEISGIESITFGNSQIPTDPVAYYPFNGNTNDESGHGHNGTLYGATLTNDRFGNMNSAFDFDGVDDWVEVPHSDELDFNNIDGDEFTAFCWVKTTVNSSELKWCLSKHESDGNWDPGFLLGTENGQLRMHFETISSTQHLDILGSYISDGQWHYIGFTLTASLNELKLYLDGSLEVTETISDGSSSNSFPFCIGSRNGVPNSHFEGEIDDIRIFNRVLNESEIQALYHEGGWDE